MTSNLRTLDTSDLDEMIERCEETLRVANRKWMVANLKRMVARKNGLEKLHRAILLGTANYIETSDGQTAPVLAVYGYSLADCIAATDDLCNRGLLREDGHEYALTTAGFDIVDILREEV